MIPISHRMDDIHSDIRGPLYFKALEMSDKGIPVLRLNTGNPAVFGFEMPESVRNALYMDPDAAVPYCDSRGMPEARRAICDYELGKGIKGLTPGDIFITNGVSEAAEMLCMALIDPGDEVLCPCPNYSLWSNSVYLAGGKPVFYTCDEKQKWNPDIADIKRKITSRTRALLLINPNNPTGALYDTEILKQMLEVARQHKLRVISDEIYDRLVFAPKQHVSTAALADDLNVVTFNGLAKSHIICGFRCGWLAIRGVNGELESLRDAVERLASLRLCSNTLTQLVIPAALEDEASTRRMLTPEGRLYRQRQAVFDVLDRADGISYVPNDAAFYLFPKFDAKRFKVTDDRELAMGMLMEKHILIVPGSGFDYPYPDHFRIVMLPEAHVLSQATKDMVEYIQSRE